MCKTLAVSRENRLIRARARMDSMHEAGGREGGDGHHLIHQVAETADLHVTLSRALLLQGAFEEADAHSRALSRLKTTTTTPTTPPTAAIADEGNRQDEDGVAGGVDAVDAAAAADSADNTALRLEIELLSRTPVVLATAESATLLRGELLGELGRLGKRGSEFCISIPNPLEVGVRAQFLATYQVTQLFGRCGGGLSGLSVCVCMCVYSALQ